MCINELFSVIDSDYVGTHFIKYFKKKYKGSWIETIDTIKNMLSRIDTFILTSKAEKIHICDTGYIAKCRFKIAGSNESPQSSGNRIIIYVDEVTKNTHILLLYGKTHIKGNNETVWRQNEIKNNHPEIAGLFSGL